MKTYIKAVVCLLLNLFVFGVLTPSLISSADTLSVCFGIGVILVDLPISYFIVKSIFKECV
jgi:hypothetical protein